MHLGYYYNDHPRGPYIHFNLRDKEIYEEGYTYHRKIDEYDTADYIGLFTRQWHYYPDYTGR